MRNFVKGGDDTKAVTVEEVVEGNNGNTFFQMADGCIHAFGTNDNGRLGMGIDEEAPDQVDDERRAVGLFNNPAEEECVEETAGSISSPAFSNNRGEES